MSVLPIEFHLPTVSSTNDYAKELLETYPYVFVSALHQTAGRGRNGKEWHGDIGQNAYVSLGITHTVEPAIEELSSYMARAALAMIATLRSTVPSATFRLKYPNDVQALTEGGWAKIGGALIEHQFQGDRCVSTIIGMGVNLLQEQFPETINQPCTSVHRLGHHADVAAFIHALKQKVSDIRTQPWSEIHRTWVQELDILGSAVRLNGSSDQWIVTDILNDGRLTARNTSTNHQRTITDGDSVRYDDRDQ